MPRLDGGRDRRPDDMADADWSEIATSGGTDLLARPESPSADPTPAGPAFHAWAVVSIKRSDKTYEGATGEVPHALSFDRFEADQFANKLRADVLAEMSQMGSVSDDFVDEMVAYRKSIRIKMVHVKGLK